MSNVARLQMHRDWNTVPAWAHPQYRYWSPTYMQIRDCMLGEQEIKAKGQVYLPKLADMDQFEYDRYRDAAVFFNMTARTVNALVGSVFQREPRVQNLPVRLEKLIDKAPHDGVSFTSFMTNMIEAQCAMGRFGILVDRGQGQDDTPYLRGYDTENIIDWQCDWVNGRFVPVQIVLREFEEQISRKIGVMRTYKVIWRVLSLDIEEDGPVYRQYIYESDSLVFPEGANPNYTVVPTNRGIPFKQIPFFFVGSKNNAPDVDRPPASDIASLNLAHYRSYAHLEHGRYFCAMPIYYVQTSPQSEKADYTLGPSRVWEVGMGEKPGILEFNGTGLKALETSLAQKEEQIAMIGGRLMGGMARSVSESDNQSKIKESNERSLLLKVVQNAEDAAEGALTFWATWQDADGVQPQVDLNLDALLDTLGARELRAAHMMYEAGVIPVTVLHDYLRKAKLIPDWMDADEFKKLLNEADEFPNQPDVWAKMQGYASAQNRQDVLLQRRTLRNAEAQTELTGKNADTNRLEVELDGQVRQNAVDVQQQLADQQGQESERAHQLAVQQQKHDQQLDRKAAARVAGPNPNSRTAVAKNVPALPKQVAAARQVA